MRIDQQGLTFDDLLLVPGYSSILPTEVDITSHLCRHIELNIPIISAAMDTVTEAPLAIAIAQEGGVGVIHKNMDIEDQAEQVRQVKKFESGIVSDPITVTPDTPVRELLALNRQHRISGVPVVEGGFLVGIITRRDVRFETQLDVTVGHIMTPKQRLVTVREGAEREQILSLLHKHRIERLLVVDDQFCLKGLITVKDIQKARDYPSACKDHQGRLRVCAAVGTGKDSRQRIDALAKSEADVLIVDTAHGHSKGVLEQIIWIKTKYPKLPVMAGNVATEEGAAALVKAGADGIKVGIGPGSICTTRIVAGIGVPQLTAIFNAAKALKGTDVTLIADGGIRYSGDVAKAIAAGAHGVMIGSLLAGTDEAPGAVEILQGRSYKTYRGMGSIGAMAQQQGSSDRYFQENAEYEKLVAEGIEGRVPYKGPVNGVIHQLVGGLRASMGYTGSANIEQMRTQPQFMRITQAGVRESHVHDVTITKEAPNYRV